MLREERHSPPSNSQSGRAHPVHPSSRSRSYASPPSTENLGPYWSPLLMLQPHLPPAGCRPQAQEWNWELAQNGNSMGGGALSIPETLFPNPSWKRLLGCAWGLAAYLPFQCLCYCPLYPSLLPPLPVPSRGPPYLCQTPCLCLSSASLLLSTRCFSLLVPLAIPPRVSEGGA